MGRLVGKQVQLHGTRFVLITFEHVQAFFFVVMGILTFIAAIAVVAGAIVRYWKFAHKQSDENAEDLKEVMTYLRNDKERIEKLEENQKVFKEENKLMLRALEKLLSHEVDGNHTDELVAMRDEILDYLIEK